MNAAGIEVHLESSNTSLDVPLAGDRAWVLERLALVHVGNSQTAGARNAYIRLTADELGLDFTYYDDGPGFDAAKALAGTGGLATVRDDVMELGGQMDIAVRNNQQVAEARLPI